MALWPSQSWWSDHSTSPGISLLPLRVGARGQFEHYGPRGQLDRRQIHPASHPSTAVQVDLTPLGCWEHGDSQESSCSVTWRRLSWTTYPGGRQVGSEEVFSQRWSLVWEGIPDHQSVCCEERQHGKKKSKRRRGETDAFFRPRKPLMN